MNIRHYGPIRDAVEVIYGDLNSHEEVKSCYDQIQDNNRISEEEGTGIVARRATVDQAHWGGGGDSATEKETSLFWRLEMKEHNFSIPELITVFTCLENCLDMEIVCCFILDHISISILFGLSL